MDQPKPRRVGADERTARVVRSGRGAASSQLDEHWMHVALEEADGAAAAGDVPVGCVIVSDAGAELGRGRNRREEHQDPCAHAEIEALRAAAKTNGHWRLEEATMYVTLEPCCMCAGALVNARVRRVVFGARDPKGGAVVSLFCIGRDERLNHRFELTAGVLADECAMRLRRFFENLRAAGEK